MNVTESVDRILALFLKNEIKIKQHTQISGNLVNW